MNESEGIDDCELTESDVYDNFFEKNQIYGALRIGDLKSFGRCGVFSAILYSLTDGNGEYNIKKYLKNPPKWIIELCDVASRNGFSRKPREIMEDLFIGLSEEVDVRHDMDMLKRLSSVDGGGGIKKWLHNVCGNSANWVCYIDGYDPVPLTREEFNVWYNGKEISLDRNLDRS